MHKTKSAKSHNHKYSNTEIKHKNGKKTIRKVYIHKCKGYKSVCEYKRGKCTYKNKHCLSKNEIEKIHNGKFIPGLFEDCYKSKKHDTRKLRR
jgi:hypothetical protein